MSESQTIEKIKGIVQETLSLTEEKTKELNGKSSLSNDLEADSIDVLEVIMGIEKEFEITIDDEAAKNMDTLEDVANFINKAKS